MPEISYIKLSDLTRKVRQVITDAFGDQTFWVVAEVSGHKFYPDRDRHYFDLVEKIENSSTETAKVKANSWEHGSKQITAFESFTGQKFEDGLQVLVCVKVNYHIIHGFSLTLQDIDPNFTLGNLERLRRQTLQRLLADNADFIKMIDGNYVTRNKVLKLNCVIQRIALIGSPKSEGYTDFVHTINTNNFGYKFTLDFFYSSVQGVSAEQELVKTLIQVYESSKTNPYDCVVITRGGGARTDFLVFDTYALSRVAAKFPIPIITGIGHHKDVSIVDLMVHTQTKTPTKAAEFILAHNRGFEEKVLQIQQRVIIRTQQMLSSQHRKINQLYSAVTQLVPAIISKRKEQCARQQQIINHVPNKLLQSAQQQLLKVQQNVLNCSTDVLHYSHRKLDAQYFKVTERPRQIVASERNVLLNQIQFFKIHIANFLASQHRELAHQRSLMKLMSPRNILKKGFAIISQDEKIIIHSSQINLNSSLVVTMDEHDIKTTIISKEEHHGKYDV